MNNKMPDAPMVKMIDTLRGMDQACVLEMVKLGWTVSELYRYPMVANSLLLNVTPLSRQWRTVRNPSSERLKFKRNDSSVDFNIIVNNKQVMSSTMSSVGFKVPSQLTVEEATTGFRLRVVAKYNDTDKYHPATHVVYREFKEDKYVHRINNVDVDEGLAKRDLEECDFIQEFIYGDVDYTLVKLSSNNPYTIAAEMKGIVNGSGWVTSFRGMETSIGLDIIEDRYRTINKVMNPSGIGLPNFDDFLVTKKTAYISVETIGRNLISIDLRPDLTIYELVTGKTLAQDTSTVADRLKHKMYFNRVERALRLGDTKVFDAIAKYDSELYRKCYG